MATVDVSGWELHNMVATPSGLRTRKAFASLKTPTAGTTYVAGFTVENPSTSEPWHYLFEQTTSSGEVTLRVVTEEFIEMFSTYLGKLGNRPVITSGVVTNQLMIGSSTMSSPLYGLVGGGLISAVKSTSINPDTTALDIPNGPLCAYGGRIAIASGSVVYFNDAVVDPRTFVAENALALPGTVYDLFQGGDGALYMFTSDGVFTLPADALGQGQQVQGFLGRIPGVVTSRPRNACATTNGTVILQRDHVLVLQGGTMRRIPLAALDDSRSISPIVEVDDARLFGEVYPTSKGFLVAFRSSRAFYLHVDLSTDAVSYWYANTGSAVVGTLRTRDGETLHLWSDRVVAPVVSGPVDHDGVAVKGYVVGHIQLAEGDNPVIRRVTVEVDNVGSTLQAAVNGNTNTTTTKTMTGDIIIGTTTWSASTAFRPRAGRTQRMTLNRRTTDAFIEVGVQGGDVRMDRRLDVELGGTWRTRPWAWA